MNLCSWLLALVSLSTAAPYPAHWWAAVPREGAPTWEIFPDQAGPGEVILSKRHELGLLSNFAATPFEYRGKHYASVEGFWQAVKYPESPSDERLAAAWPHTRVQVQAMTAFEAKDAGDEANAVMKKLGIDWVTFEGKKMRYLEKGESPFYKLIKEVMRAKLAQNPRVREVLLQTGDLKLKPDHHDSEGPELKAWRYYEIWMDLRTELQKKN